MERTQAMSNNLKSFTQFISEELTQAEKAELRSMGFSEPFENRLNLAISEFYSDPEVDAAITLLRKKHQEHLDAHIDAADMDADDWNSHVYSLANETPPSNLGIFDVLAM